MNEKQCLWIYIYYLSIINLNVGGLILRSEIEYMQERVSLVMNKRAKRMLEIINWCHLGSCIRKKESIGWSQLYCCTSMNDNERIKKYSEDMNE